MTADSNPPNIGDLQAAWQRSADDPVEADIAGAVPFEQLAPDGPVEPGTADGPEAGNRGRFVPGVPGPALRHGGFSKLVARGRLPEQAAVLAQLAEEQTEIEADLGRSDLSTVRRNLIGDYLRLRLIGEHLAGNILEFGPLTAKGRQRAALSAYLAVVDRLHRVSGAIGLERRARAVTFDSFVRGEDA